MDKDGPKEISVTNLAGDTFSIHLFFAQHVLEAKKKLEVVSGVRAANIELMTIDGRDLLDNDTCPQLPLSMIILPPLYSEFMGVQIEPGSYEIQFWSCWASEMESCSLTEEQAEFWSKNDRADLLNSDYVDMESVLEEWDETIHGETPKDGDPGYKK